MRWWTMLLGSLFHHRPATPSPEAVKAVEQSKAREPRVEEVANRSDRLLSRNGFIEALTRSQER